MTGGVYVNVERLSPTRDRAARLAADGSGAGGAAEPGDDDGSHEGRPRLTWHTS
jgi:hypothetical protein